MKKILCASMLFLSVSAGVIKPMEQAMYLGAKLAYPPAVTSAIHHIYFGKGHIGMRTIQAVRIGLRMVTIGLCAGYVSYAWTCESPAECNTDNLLYNTAAVSMVATNGYMLYNMCFK